jgi:hypothetical protein
MPTEFNRAFRAEPKTRRSEVASVLIYSFLVFLALAVGAFIVLQMHWDIDARDRPGYFWLVLGAPLIISAAVAWSWARCRFEQVEVIRMGQVPDAAITLEGRGVRMRVWLDPSELLDCANAVAEKCPNAIIEDPLGRLHCSRKRTDARKVETTALKYTEKKAWGFLYGGVAAGAVGLLWLHELFIGGKVSGNDWLEAILIFSGSLGCAWASWSSFRQARRLRESLAEEKQPGRPGA